jgi:hypothetical protein
METYQLKISVPLSLRETYRLIPLSAKQISLDSPFKHRTLKRLISIYQNLKFKNQTSLAYRRNVESSESNPRKLLCLSLVTADVILLAGYLLNILVSKHQQELLKIQTVQRLKFEIYR